MRKQIVVVLGMHRSGTSLITKGLECLGVELSESMIPEANDNVKGFWEDADILNFNERLLNLAGKHWYSIEKFDLSDINKETLESLICEAYEIISKKLDTHFIWGFKDPRTCVLLEFWSLIFNRLSSVDVKFLVCLRNPVEVFGSLNKRDDILEHHAYFLWLQYVVSSLSFLKDNSNTFIVDYEDILYKSESILRDIAINFHLNINETKLKQFSLEYLDDSLRHNIYRDSEVLSPVAVFMTRFYELLWEAKYNVDFDSIIEQYQLSFSKLLEQEAAQFSEIQLLKSSELIRNIKDKLDRDERDFRREINRLTEENNQLNNNFDLITASISWKITKPIRLITNPRAYLPIIKKYIKRTPLFPIARFLHLKYSSVRSYIFNAPLSKQNIKYINQTSSKRANELLSARHVNSITAKLDLDDLPNIDISIVTYNNGSWLKNFTKSLIEQSYPIKKLNLHFVDNGSNDETIKLLEAFKLCYQDTFGDIQIYSRPNLGFGAGHDYAIQQFKNDFFLVTNIDLEFSKNALVNVIKFAINDSNEVACWELRQKPYEHPKYYDPITLEVAWSSHACVVIRKDAYEKVGGYEPRIFMYGEDVELSYRFRSHGYLLRYIPHASVYHYTYEEAHQIKPLQFSGSTMANTLLRFRYGSLKDKIVGVLLQGALFMRGAGFHGSRKLVLANLKKLTTEIKYFPSIDRKPGYYFPFRYFDYEMVRDGAFYELSDFQIGPDTPLITIITRTYRGREFFLKECMASVINQTYPNIQHIIVEDGGETHADLVNMVKSSYGQFYNVEFYGFEKKGRSFTGNQGLKMANGEFCLFLDDDDLIFPDHIEVLVSEILKDSTLSAVYSLAWDVHTEVDKKSLTYKESAFETNNLFYQEFDYQTLLDHNYIPIQSILFKKKLYEEKGGFEEDMDQLEDWNLWTRYAVNTQFKFVRKTTSLYRTPANPAERLRRATSLDSAFKDALAKQKEI